MQPQQPYQPGQFQQPQYSIDYLNNIAPTPQKPIPTWRRFAIPGVIVALVLFVLMWAFSLLHGATNVNLSSVTIRMQSLQKITDSAQRNIKSNQLRVTNSNLSLYLTNANRDSTTLLKADGVDATKLKPSASAQAADDQLSSRLEDARLNAIFDRTYAREMNYQLTTLLIQMQQLHKSAGPNQRQFLDTTSANLSAVQQQFASYDDSTN